MSGTATTLTGSQGSRSTGIVTGYVLKLARQSAGLTQERLAERLAVDGSTVQGWESGRRPLSAMPAGDFVRLSARLPRLGAHPSTGRHLRAAVEADLVLSTGIAAGDAWVDPDVHPLAASVHRKTLTNLITWPFTGHLPQELTVFAPKVPRRGPVAPGPTMGAAERTRFFDHLMTVAERGVHTDAALLRRQAVYLLGFDQRDQVVEWLRGEWASAGRRPIADGDVTSLLEARSASVALASTGDSSHLHDFVTRTTGSRAELANLNYWAHWIGELPDDQTDDTFMAADDTRAWAGVRLFHHLVSRLDPASPHLPLNLHTVHTLVASRPALLTERSAARDALSEALEVLTSADVLTRDGRDQVAGLHYALRLADR
ncbi:helix-turn-helix transcriptional regulator [Amycolatopsis sp. FDAARGOS 1241]|uniref:helix-turn-helix domain-containing protein n=1 Tax=Amycolatopsis sp. FDAARGOS 1241 TaxID=2778070 RepID=UPI00195230DD|nr:helix-turn-helix transcriptional regulator [Amycolatopsis sp. FDAARGOS 1241]QRP48019.1 helix-turn-helix transcriptional regulator [Amycolatopsis sp. FDAARGOS 1241]